MPVEGTTIDGKPHKAEGYDAAYLLRRVMATNPKDQKVNSGNGKNKNAEAEDEARAVGKIFAGDFEGAVAILKKLEEDRPGQYSTAANLGTAYELMGDNENALKWITTGVTRNPDSHYGTEWLHVLILEAKIEAARHPAQPLQSRLLPVPDRLTADTLIPVNGKNRTASDVIKALDYQLHERLVFVKPKDPYVADLLYSFALIQANLHTVEEGMGLLELAREFGFPDEALIKQHEE